MRKTIVAGCLLALCFNFSTMAAKEKTVELRIIETTDVHGAFFPYDFINRKPRAGSLARVSSYVGRMREKYGKNVILLENGDILQGQPVNYFSNYIDTLDHNVAADVINYLKYDAQGLGNHDIETGHKCYDKWIKELACPTVAANAIDATTGKTYTKPYIIFHRDGVKIAVLGLITPAIPNWLEQRLWTGMRFDNMLSAARHWMKVLREEERPDVVIGLFHSGREGGITTAEYQENASLEIAKEVPGFHVVLFGHDHTRYMQTVTNVEGQPVLCLNPANNAMAVGVAALTLKGKKGKWTVTQSTGALEDMTKEEVDKAYEAHFQPFIDKVNAYVNQKIGTFENTIYTRDSYFGNSAFTDLIHNLQLEITGADISFNAPLSFDEHIKKGDVLVSDMFNLYKFENQLYVMRMTGKEIRQYLEMSYGLWTNTMTQADDHLLLLDVTTRNDVQRLGFKNFSFNFDSAAGIDYEVDVTKPQGQKVHILQMSNGKPFDEEAWYRVAVNSYRGNGGGELMTRGAGIPKDSLDQRIVWRSEKDQRHYLMEEVCKAGTLDPQPNHNWKFVPESWTLPAAARDRALLFHTK